MSATDLPDLRLGQAILTVDARWTLTQTYSEIRADSLQRNAEGRLLVRRAWAPRLRTVITGTGKLPLALAGLDTSAPVTLSCVAPRHVGNTLANSVSVPAARRAGGIYTPRAWAIVNGRLQATSASVTGNLVTCGVVAGAAGYQVSYYPEIGVYITAIDDGLDTASRTHDYTWSITAEEI